MTGALARPTRALGLSGPKDVIVVEPGTGVPPWMDAWARTTGRAVLRRTLGEAGGSGPFEGPEMGTACAAIALDAATGGHAVLLARPSLEGRRGEPAQVVAAVRRLPDDLSALDAAAVSARCMEGTLILVHCVPRSFGERSVGLADALADGNRVLSRAARYVARAHPDLTVGKRLIRMRAHEMLGEEPDADLLVLGSAHPTPPVRLGLVALSAVQHAACPVLLVLRQR